MQPRHRKVIGIPDKHPIPIHSKSNMFQTQSIIFLFCCPNSGKFPSATFSLGYRKNINQKPHAQWVIGLSVSVGTFRLRELKKNLCVDNQSPESTHTNTKGTATYKKWVLIFATYNEVRPTIECALQS